MAGFLTLRISEKIRLYILMGQLIKLVPMLICVNSSCYCKLSFGFGSEHKKETWRLWYLLSLQEQSGTHISR